MGSDNERQMTDIETALAAELDNSKTDVMGLMKLNAFLVCCGVAVDNGIARDLHTRLTGAASGSLFEWRTGHVGIPMRLGNSENADLRVLTPISRFVTTEISPIVLTHMDEGYKILVHGSPFVSVEIDPIPLPEWVRKKTEKSKVPYSRVLQNDIGNLMGTIPNKNGFQECHYSVSGKACIFCALERKEKRVQPLEYAEVVADAVSEYPKITVTLTGGNANDRNRGLELYLPYIKAIRDRNSDVPVEVEASPPRDVDLIDKLAEVGMTSFNSGLEVFDDSKRKEVCPVKGAIIPKKDYWRAFERADEIGLPCYSALIVGLDENASILQGVEALSELGVMTNPLPFRPLKGSILENEPPLDPLRYLSVCREALSIMTRHGVNPRSRKKGGCGLCGGCSVEVNLDRV